MTGTASNKSQASKLMVPTGIQDVIADFDKRTGVYTCADVSGALGAARTTLKSVCEAEDKGAWAEVLAFNLAGFEHGEKPWGTHYGPMGSGTRADGEIVYFPDLREADAEILQHWKTRARSLNAPVLVSRYADLAWDLETFIAKSKRDVEFARIAIDAYLVIAAQGDRDSYDAFHDAERALVLAIQITDSDRRDKARTILLDLHRVEVAKNGMWWRCFDSLVRQPKSGLTETELSSLIEDIEGVLTRVSERADPTKFDPHAVESAAKTLIKHYRRVGQNAEVARLYEAIGRAFEHFGSMGDALLASTVLQTSMDGYRQAGLQADADRILGLVEKSNVESIAQMKRFEHREEIPKEAVEEFLSQIVAASKEETFGRIAGEFLSEQSKVEENLRKTAKSSPLLTAISKTMVQGDRIVAQIGSLDDDPIGHLIERANLNLHLRSAWLGWTIERAQKMHELTIDDFVGWSNRTGLFSDDRLLREGIAAWLEDDHVKAIHILVPQVEAGFRTLVGRCGRPTTKPHLQMRQARMVITLGEILCHKETAPALGEHGSNIVLHFRALYTDPRGSNLRNNIAHGLIQIDAANASIVTWIIHSLLLLGAWDIPARK